MDSIIRMNFKLLAAVALSMLNYIECSPLDNVAINVTTPCENVAEAINRLYRSLPDQMPLEARCRRYAVFLSMADTAGSTYQLALLQVAAMKEEILDILYGEISTADLASRYMSTIDVYRTAHLEPAFIDLIECLEQIETLQAREYSYDPSLIKIVDLYRQALGPPANTINPESIDLRGFPPAFRDSLRNLFEVHNQDTRNAPHQCPTLIDLFNELSSSYLPQKRLAEQYIVETERRLRRKDLRRQYQRKFRERHLELIREKDRIQKMQKRRLQPSPSQLRQEQRPCRPDELAGTQLEDSERKRIRRLERQKRYRERHAHRLLQKRRERQQRRRELKQQIPVIRTRPYRVPRPSLDLTLGQKQRRKQGSDSAPVPAQSVPIILESSRVNHHVDRPNHQSKKQVLACQPQPEDTSGQSVQRQCRPEELKDGQLEKLRRKRVQSRERQQRFRERNRPRLLEQARERYRQRQQRLQQQGNPTPEDPDESMSLPRKKDR